MIALTAFTTLILAVLDQSTRPRVEIQQQMETHQAILFSAGIESTEENVESLYTERMKPVAGEENVYEYYEGSELKGHVIPFEGSLLWGSATGYLGIAEDGKSLLGMDIVSNAETPGLGGRITEDWFRKQFQSLALKEEPPYLIYRPAAGGNVDAITGATQTSESLRIILNKTLTEYFEKKGGN